MVDVRKICVVTGTRSDYGLLYWLMKTIQVDLELQLQLIVTGMHLSPEFGLTYKQIEDDGFISDVQIEMLLSSDTPVGIAKSIGLGVIGFAEAFYRLKPDIVVVLGDRYEILAATQAAMVARIPIAHIGGGDITEGAFDEAIRHSITKMSFLHFVTNSVAARRIMQMGENPDFVYNVGSLGIEQIKKTKLLVREDLESRLKFRFMLKNILITFHPATLDDQSAEAQFSEVLTALEQLGDQVGLLFTKPNSDPGGRVIIQLIDNFVARHSNARAYTSLGSLIWLSAIAQVDAVVGNSSAGLYEVPSFQKPTVNIGSRQSGRLQAPSVINCITEAISIEKAIRQAFTKDCSETVNPYGDGNTAKKIVSILKEVPINSGLLKKKFFEV